MTTTIQTPTATATATGEQLYATHVDVDRLAPTIHPRGVTATRKALRNHHGEPGNAIRSVAISWDSVPPTATSDDVDVYAPTDGRPLVIWHYSFAHLRIKSGHVVIMANSAAGNPVDVEDGATATIIANPDRKVSVTAHRGATVHLHADEGGRHRVSVWTRPEDRGLVNVTVTGDAQQK